jgi:hypothetical protein
MGITDVLAKWKARAERAEADVIKYHTQACSLEAALAGARSERDEARRIALDLQRRLDALNERTP